MCGVGPRIRIRGLSSTAATEDDWRTTSLRTLTPAGVDPQILIGIVFNAPPRNELDPPEALAAAFLVEATGGGDRVSERVLLLPLERVATCEVPLSGGWWAFARFFLTDDVLVLGELSVFPGGDDRGRIRPKRRRDQIDPEDLSKAGWLIPGRWDESQRSLNGVIPGGVTSDRLREVPLGRIKDRVSFWISELTHKLPEPDRDTLAALDRPITRPGRSGRDDHFYAVWAQRYVKALGESSSPHVYLAENHKNYTATQIRDLVFKARDRGLLSGGGRGKRGGQLTPKALEVLSSKEEDE